MGQASFVGRQKLLILFVGGEVFERFVVGVCCGFGVRVGALCEGLLMLVGRVRARMGLRGVRAWAELDHCRLFWTGFLCRISTGRLLEGMKKLVLAYAINFLVYFLVVLEIARRPLHRSILLPLMLLMPEFLPSRRRTLRISHPRVC